MKINENQTGEMFLNTKIDFESSLKKCLEEYEELTKEYPHDRFVAQYDEDRLERINTISRFYRKEINERANSLVDLAYILIEETPKSDINKSKLIYQLKTSGEMLKLKSKCREESFRREFLDASREILSQVRMDKSEFKPLKSEKLFEEIYDLALQWFKKVVLESLNFKEETIYITKEKEKLSNASQTTIERLIITVLKDLINPKRNIVNVHSVEVLQELEMFVERMLKIYPSNALMNYIQYLLKRNRLYQIMRGNLPKA